jgi:hypothetical protein
MSKKPMRKCVKEAIELTDVFLRVYSPQVAAQYGHIQDARSEMESRLRAAIDSKDWTQAVEISQQLDRQFNSESA